MHTNEKQIKFQGFHPSSFTRSYLDERLDQILEEAPYGATMRATFKRDGHTFKGFLAIYSSAGKFFSVANGTRLKEVTQILTRQVRRDLAKWKQHRFQYGQENNFVAS